MCIDVPQPEDAEMSVVFQPPERIVKQRQWPATGEVWQATLGEALEPALGRAGVRVEGAVKTPNQPMGEVKFEQHINFWNRFVFESGDSTVLDYGDNWYLDEKTPYEYSYPETCSGGICGYMLDSPAYPLQLLRAMDGSFLIEFEALTRFETYLLWYPHPSCVVPLRKIGWEWYIHAAAVKKNDYQPGKYPWEWKTVASKAEVRGESESVGVMPNLPPLPKMYDEELNNLTEWF